MFRSSNPALRTDYFRDLAGTASGDQAMTVNGTANKTGLMLLILITGATLTWTGNPATIGGLAMLGGIGGFIAALVTIFKKEYARYSAPVYAFLEGLFLGAISSVFEAQYPGIVQQAVLLTFGTAGAMLLAYRSGMIKVTEKFKLGVFAATGGIAVAYFLGWIMSFFGANVSILWGEEACLESSSTYLLLAWQLLILSWILILLKKPPSMALLNTWSGTELSA